MLLPQLGKKKRFAKYLKKSESKNFLPSKRLLIKLVYLLISHHLIPACLATGRPQTVEVDYAEGQPTIPLLINTVSTTAVPDSGAGFSLLSFILFRKMNIDQSKLIRSQQFNIKTANGLVADAVVGHITLLCLN